ncbi:transcriptional repressor TCF25-domain-containing protein [Xylaria arbuscula]|nr:transcriptional repressor TCF25-domain-containing protein [Xylaria arbuscula]
MSSRQLRKLQRQRELQQPQAPSPADNSSDESDAGVPIQRPANRAAFSGFAALGGQDDSEDDENQENDETQNEPTSASTHHTESAAPIEATHGPSNKSKKKKKKKAKKANTTVKPPSQPDTPKNGEDEIDKALRQLNLANTKSSTPAHSQTDKARSMAYERICELLRINTYHLKVVNEMRNLFGRDAIAAVLNEENEERARTHRARHMQLEVDLETFLKGQPGQTLPEVTLRRNPFLPGKDIWPRASTEGLGMKQIKDTAGTVEFGFAHSPEYNKLETDFFERVQTLDPMQMVQFVHSHPYHISALIQVSKIAKQDQNSALSADLCERALFTFGRVALSSFRQKIEEGKARLDFRRPENRQFWLAGYHYLKSLVMKGTYRTALEWAKLLFSMDSSDPYGMIHFIHPIAIRAHESKWFIDFCDSEVLDNFDTAQDYIRQTLVLARLQQKDTAGAKALLIEGMERLPWLYGRLYKALNLDVPKAIWGMQPRDSHEEFFVELYIHQAKSLWDNAQATGLLKEAAHEVKKPDFQTFGFPPVAGRNVARFVYLDNTPSLMGHVPGGLLSTSPNWEFDPIPPPKEENVFSYDSQLSPWTSNEYKPPGFDLPRDGPELRRLLAQLGERGGPQANAVIEAALARFNNLYQGDDGDDIDSDGDNDNDNDDEGGAAEGREGLGPGVFQTVMDLFGVRGPAPGGDNEEEDGQPRDRWNLAESELDNRMPGAWESDSSDGEADGGAEGERE